MRKLLCAVLSLVLVLSLLPTAMAEFTLPPKTDKSTLPRVIITTDMEVDDANGILLTLMYANEMDIAGLVSTAGMWHFNGDGEHTLGEITPNYRCNVVDADKLTSFRPAEPNQIARFISTFYAEDYEYLKLNNPDYPSPEELLAVYAEGNVAFEGDVRFDTDGSNLIKAAILDDDPRPLYIHHWGGSNTTVRALLSIYEEYHDTDQWDEILARVVGKVVMVGEGEDYCVENEGIKEKFPGLVFGGLSSFFSYGSYGAAVDGAEYYQSEWLLDAFKRNHGQVLGHFYLSGDGQVVYGEPMVAQYGLKTWVDWKELRPNYSNSSYLDFVPRWDMDNYDWLCCQFSTEYIDIGLRHDVNNKGKTTATNIMDALNIGDHYTAIMFDELAARADWAILPADQCNHAPMVNADVKDFTAAPGGIVSMEATAEDPDGNDLKLSWYVSAGACVYAAKTAEDGTLESFELPVTANGLTAQVTIPEDAKAGDVFVVNLEVQDEADRPMTRFVQYVIVVE